MLDKLKHTLKHTFIYSLGNLSAKLVGLILLPLYTSHLSTSEYGILSLLEASSQVIVGILGFGMANAMMRWFVSEKSDNSINCPGVNL